MEAVEVVLLSKRLTKMHSNFFFKKKKRLNKIIKLIFFSFLEFFYTINLLYLFMY
jgi:hypothetical protein